MTATPDLAVRPAPPARAELGALWVLLALSVLAALAPASITGIPALVLGWLPVVFAAWHLTRWVGWRYAIGVFAIIVLVSFFVEALGVATGLVFGNYYYPAGPLGPLLLGVPPLIQLQYFAMGYASLHVGRAVTGTLAAPARGATLFLSSVVAAFSMTILDLASDPRQSTQLGMWIWRDGGDFFGVPVHNFVGWFVGTFVFFVLLQWLLTRPAALARLTAPRPPAFGLQGLLLFGTFPFAIVVRPFVEAALGGAATSIEGAMVAVALFAVLPLWVVALIVWRRDHPASGARASRSAG